MNYWVVATIYIYYFVRISYERFIHRLSIFCIFLAFHVALLNMVPVGSCPNAHMVNPILLLFSQTQSSYFHRWFGCDRWLATAVFCFKAVLLTLVLKSILSNSYLCSKIKLFFSVLWDLCSCSWGWDTAALLNLWILRSRLVLVACEAK